jgi:hypothetical protein
MSDSLAQPVGHTSEASASLGGAGTLYSPFSPFHDQHLARKIEVAEIDAARRTRNNPPLTAAETKNLLQYQGSSKVIIPNHAVLAVAGCMVNREWASAAKLCDNLAAFARKKSKGGGEGSGVTFVTVFGKMSQYCNALAAGKPPIRTPHTKAEKKDKKTSTAITIWQDVAKCALAEDGNVKLPFAAYSEMPIVTCPGAGGVAGKFAQMGGAALGAANVSDGVDVRGCASFCYSLKALRNPTVCYRLLVLTLGMSIDPAAHVAVVVDCMLKLHAKRGTKIMRLFVDGDFRSAAAIETWMEGIRVLGKHGIQVYGYSKSWPEFLDVDKRRGRNWWPENYTLNLSSGSRYFSDPAWLAHMKALPVTRGEFIAVDPLERLTWKAFTKARGVGIWRGYQKRINAIANGKAKKAAQKRAYTALRDRLGRLIAKANPDLAQAYNEYVSTVHDLEAKNKTVLTRVRNAIGEKTMIPGPLVQASTYAFLKKVADGEMPCPISCGSCPSTAIPAHEKVIEAARLGQTELLEGMKLKDKITERAIQASKLGGNTHLCGTKRATRAIVIGVH